MNYYVIIMYKKKIQKNETLLKLSILELWLVRCVAKLWVKKAEGSLRAKIPNFRAKYVKIPEKEAAMSSKEARATW